MKQEIMVQEILKEVERAEKKFPGWPQDLIHASAVVQEECGELVQSCLEATYEGGDHVDVMKEAIQTGAMVIRFLKNFESMRTLKCKQI